MSDISTVSACLSQILSLSLFLSPSPAHSYYISLHQFFLYHLPPPITINSMPAPTINFAIFVSERSMKCQCFCVSIFDLQFNMFMFVRVSVRVYVHMWASVWWGHGCLGKEFVCLPHCFGFSFTKRHLWQESPVMAPGSSKPCL